MCYKIYLYHDIKINIILLYFLYLFKNKLLEMGGAQLNCRTVTDLKNLQKTTKQHKDYSRLHGHTILSQIVIICLNLLIVIVVKLSLHAFVDIPTLLKKNFKT